MHAKDNHATLAKIHPLGRMGEISDIVGAVLYLQNATFVTGENIRVMPVDNKSTIAKPGSRLRELGLVLPKAPTRWEPMSRLPRSARCCF
jgi:hypothetical protein